MRVKVYLTEGTVVAGARGRLEALGGMQGASPWQSSGLTGLRLPRDEMEDIFIWRRKRSCLRILAPEGRSESEEGVGGMELVAHPALQPSPRAVERSRGLGRSNPENKESRITSQEHLAGAEVLMARWPWRGMWCG